MSKRDSYGKYKRQANGTKNYEFYDKYGKKIIINSPQYSDAFRLAKSRGLSNRKPSVRGVD